MNRNQWIIVGIIRGFLFVISIIQVRITKEWILVILPDHI